MSSSAEFSPDGKRIVTASGDKTARIWDAETYQQIAVLKGHEDAVSSAAFSPDGKRIVTASADTAKIWDAKTYAAISALSGDNCEIMSAAFSPDGGAWSPSPVTWRRGYGTLKPLRRLPRSKGGRAGRCRMGSSLRSAPMESELWQRPRSLRTRLEFGLFFRRLKASSSTASAQFPAASLGTNAKRAFWTLSHRCGALR